MAALSIRLAALMLQGAVITTAASAQTQEADLRPGTTVRATLSDRSVPITGALVRVEPGRLILRTGSDETQLDPRAIVRLERRTVQRHTATGALVGTAVGSAAAIAFAIGFCNDPDTRCEVDEYARIGLIFVTPPALAGALIGSLIRTERWSPVSLAPYLALDGGRGIGLRVRLSF